MSIHGWDVRWFLWVNRSAHSAALDWILPPIAHYGRLSWLALLVVILFLDRQRGKLVFLTGITAWGFSSYLGDTVLKSVFKHPRPNSLADLADKIHLLAAVPASFSFPSGDATVSFAVAGVIAYFYSGWKRWAALLSAALIAYSRVYVGVHFPSDVMGGAILGLLVGYMGTALAGRWWRQTNAPARKPSPKKS
jgi:undecaprenyl-diphosphatase